MAHGLDTRLCTCKLFLELYREHARWRNCGVYMYNVHVVWYMVHGTVHVLSGRGAQDAARHAALGMGWGN
jgi:hypothetical protein